MHPRKKPNCYAKIRSSQRRDLFNENTHLIRISRYRHCKIEIIQLRYKRHKEENYLVEIRTKILTKIRTESEETEIIRK